MRRFTWILAGLLLAVLAIHPASAQPGTETPGPTGRGGPRSGIDPMQGMGPRGNIPDTPADVMGPGRCWCMPGCRGLGPAMMGRHESGGGDEDMPGRMVREGLKGRTGRIVARLRGLDLAADQWRRIRNIQSSTQMQVILKVADLRVARMDLQEMLLAPRPDAGKIRDQIKKVYGLEESIAQLRIEGMMKGREVLTPDQLEKFLDPTWHPGWGSRMSQGMGRGTGLGRDPRN